MLPTEAPYPYPGSFALLADGHLWRVLRHNADATITLTRAPQGRGTTVPGLRTVDQAELHDPAGPVAQRTQDERTLALRLAHALRTHDEISVPSARDHAHHIRFERGLHVFIDQRLLTGLMQDLGWRRERGEDGPVFRRISTPLSRVDLNSRQTSTNGAEVAA